MGISDWLRAEHAILAVRGKPTVMLTNRTMLLRAPWRGHSVKPVEFHDLVESLCPPRYADLFSRYQHNDKWDCHGDEALSADADVMPGIPASLRREPVA
jgi:N6-adenosine-specific RNA methylase IME4